VVSLKSANTGSTRSPAGALCKRSPDLSVGHLFSLVRTRTPAARCVPAPGANRIPGGYSEASSHPSADESSLLAYCLPRSCGRNPRCWANSHIDV